MADKIVTRSVEELIPYARNAGTHSDEQVAQIAGSIREFVFTNPGLGPLPLVAGRRRRRNFGCRRRALPAVR